jgi:hypothetical protein
MINNNNNNSETFIIQRRLVFGSSRGKNLAVSGAKNHSRSSQSQSDHARVVAQVAAQDERRREAGL